ncbi:MAG TPA: DUF1697 domain-containing protein [Chthoniobacterales bacterium]|nr:DUF1697 domain-containing protein [Chthoniobacterales bacterium]
MPRLIAFLRAINVGGHIVTMAELRGLFESLSFQEVETFIASGNVIFASSSKDVGALQKKIEDQLLRSLGYEVKTFLRTIPEVAAIAQYKPFNESQLGSAAALNVAFLADSVSAEAEKALVALKTEIDDFHVQGREVYWLCKTKQSGSKFSYARFEKVLNVRATWRNINTVVRLAAKYA